MTARYHAEDLRSLAYELLCKKGLHRAMAQSVAEVLLEGDLLGHTTHGLQLLAPYLNELDAGTMTSEGNPEILQDHGMSIFWDGRYLPGPWLVTQAIDTGLKRMQTYPVFTASIKQCHHTACLAAYLERVAEKGYLIFLTVSDPTLGSKVSPFGGKTPVYTPNPMAAAWSLKNGLVILDISMSTTSIGLAQRLSRQKKRLPGRWVLDADGRVTDNPGVIFEKPSGSILPLGSLDRGHKGYALGLLVEALTSGLCGFGRKDKPGRWGATVFMMMINPDALGGRDRFVEETTWLAEACQNAEPIDPENPVRLPGQSALAKKRRYLNEGIELEPGILPGLEEWSNNLGIRMPEPIAD